MTTDSIDVGVIGVGSMGQHHARVYSELPQTNLVGISDLDQIAAGDVASECGTSVLSKHELLEHVDAASVAVPTDAHYDVAMDCLEADVAVLLEKPAVMDLSRGRKLDRAANRAGLPIQVGHIERFNPAVTTVAGIVDDLDIMAIRAHRLGPEPDRFIEDSAVMDLMIHDIDVVRSLVGEEPVDVSSTGIEENCHASALLQFESGVMGSLTASRLTQRKIRRLEITARECYIEVDYTDQSVEIHRSSVPEYVVDNGDVHFRHESLVERPTVSNREPLKEELTSFVETVTDGTEPRVTLEDGIRAVEIARQIERGAEGKAAPPRVMEHD